jgi:hypothetical protein
VLDVVGIERRLVDSRRWCSLIADSGGYATAFSTRWITQMPYRALRGGKPILGEDWAGPSTDGTLT